MEFHIYSLILQFKPLSILLQCAFETFEIQKAKFKNKSKNKVYIVFENLPQGMFIYIWNKIIFLNILIKMKDINKNNVL